MKKHMESAKKYLTTKSAGDRAVNGLLLRADIHKCFDDYQFGIYVSNSFVYAIIDTHSRL